MLPDPAGLAAAIPAEATGCVVAFSGGLDSTVLLHLAARCDHPLRAIHVHHGLQHEADDWVVHCRRVCAGLGVALRVVHVDPIRCGRGLEAAARDARYAAIAARMEEGECLLTAHHADDQLETLLLRMMRGTGPDGLAGIPSLRDFGPGWLARPLLAFPRERLRVYAQTHDLHWVEDSTNAELDQDRNYLRHRVIPALQSRWTHAAEMAGRLARHSAQQRDGMQVLLQGYRRQWPGGMDGPLPLGALREADPLTRPALLRQWLRAGGLPLPGEARLQAGLDMLMGAGGDRRPGVVWGEYQIRRHREWLFRLPWPLPESPDPVGVGEADDICWGALGWIGLDSALGHGLRVRVAGAGERITMPQRPAKPIKALLREANVVPWWRRRLPVLEHSDGEVLAVAGLGVTAAGRQVLATGCRGLDWRPWPRPQGPDWAWLTPPR